MGILSELKPKPDLAVLSVAGQPCYNGGGFTGTATEFILESLKRLEYPKQVTWALHDRGPIPPFEIDLGPLEVAVRDKTHCSILDLPHGKPQKIFV